MHDTDPDQVKSDHRICNFISAVCIAYYTVYILYIQYRIQDRALRFAASLLCCVYRQYGRSFLVSVLRDLLTSLIFGERPEQFAVKL